MPIPIVQLLCGCPTSGKSTYALKEIARPENANTVIISTDNLIETYAREEGKTYNEVFDEYYFRANAEMHENFRTAIRQKQSIIWDQTNLTVKSRRKKLSNFPSYYIKVAVYFIIPYSDLIQRNKNRAGKIISENTLKNMYDTYTIPACSEGFDRCIYGDSYT
jgi:predicted kinase